MDEYAVDPELYVAALEELAKWYKKNHGYVPEPSFIKDVFADLWRVAATHHDVHAPRLRAAALPRSLSYFESEADFSREVRESAKTHAKRKVQEALAKMDRVNGVHRSTLIGFFTKKGINDTLSARLVDECILIKHR